MSRSGWQLMNVFVKPRLGVRGDAGGQSSIPPFVPSRLRVNVQTHTKARRHEVASQARNTLSYTPTPRYAPSRLFPSVDPKLPHQRISGGCHRVTFVTFVKKSDTLGRPRRNDDERAKPFAPSREPLYPFFRHPTGGFHANPYAAIVRTS